MNNELTQERIKKLLTYTPETGLFTWNASPSPKVNVGDRAGGVRSDGYCYIRINGKAKLAHRLAWLYVNGNFPSSIDHINHKKSDNRISNLRDVPHSANQKNQSMRSDNKSGCSGVRWKVANKNWVATIRVDGTFIHLRNFKDKVEAIKARKKAEKKYDFHPNHGKALQEHSDG